MTGEDGVCYYFESETRDQAQSVIIDNQLETETTGGDIINTRSPISTLVPPRSQAAKVQKKEESGNTVFTYFGLNS